MTVVDSTLAEPARPVARSTERSDRVDGSVASVGPSAEVQAVTHASAAVTAIEADRTACRRARHAPTPCPRVPPRAIPALPAR